jgi:hypothetical protein
VGASPPSKDKEILREGKALYNCMKKTVYRKLWCKQIMGFSLWFVVHGKKSYF